MELTQLKYFVAAANCGQIVQAAEMMQVSQSAISMAISRLEKELETNLFEKQGRSIKLTQDGQQFLNMVAPAMAELDFAAASLQSSKVHEPNTITLSVEMPDFATPFECLYCELHPGAKIRQGMDPTDITKQKLLMKKVDFSLTFERITNPDITSILLFQEPVYVQIANRHPLAKNNALHLSELAETPFVSLSPEYSFRRWTDGMCFLSGFRPNVSFEVGDTQSMTSIAIFLNAAVFIGRSTYEESLAVETGDFIPESLETIPLLDRHCQRSVYLSYHNNRIMTEEAKEFIDFSLSFKAAMERYGHFQAARKWLASGESLT